MAKKEVVKEPVVVVEPVVVKSIDLKDTLEYFAALELIVDQFNIALEDGKIDFSDAGCLLKLVTEYKVFVEAIQDSGNVVTELKDLDESEMIQLGLAAFAMVKKIVAVVKAAKK